MRDEHPSSAGSPLLASRLAEELRHPCADATSVSHGQAIRSKVSTKAA